MSWIKLTDKEPLLEQWVLVHLKAEKYKEFNNYEPLVLIMRLTTSDKYWECITCCKTTFDYGEVSHWMLLPEEPKE